MMPMPDEKDEYTQDNNVILFYVKKLLNRQFDSVH